MMVLTQAPNRSPWGCRGAAEYPQFLSPDNSGTVHNHSYALFNRGHDVPLIDDTKDHDCSKELGGHHHRDGIATCCFPSFFNFVDHFPGPIMPRLTEYELPTTHLL